MPPIFFLKLYSHFLTSGLPDGSFTLQAAALKAMCNVVVDFKDKKTIFIQSGCVKQLVQLSKSMDPVLRINAVWALRNLMFHADRAGREHILCELTEAVLAGLICGNTFSFSFFFFFEDSNSFGFNTRTGHELIPLFHLRF